MDYTLIDKEDLRNMYADRKTLEEMQEIWEHAYWSSEDYGFQLSDGDVVQGLCESFDHFGMELSVEFFNTYYPGEISGNYLRQRKDPEIRKKIINDILSSWKHYFPENSSRKIGQQSSAQRLINIISKT